MKTYNNSQWGERKLQTRKMATKINAKSLKITKMNENDERGSSTFLDPHGGSLSLTHVVVLVDFFVSQPTVFIETS